jgi:hypothetical protein
VELREERNLTHGPCGTNAVLPRMGCRPAPVDRLPQAFSPTGENRYPQPRMVRTRDARIYMSNSTCDFAISPRLVRPSFANLFALKRRGRGEDRVRAAPAVPCAKVANKTHTSIQVQRKQSGLPCAMVLQLISCSPR